MQTLNVDLGSRSYPIHIGHGLLSQKELFQQAIRGNKVLIVSDSNVAPLYAEKLQASLSDFDAELIVLPAGEKHKHLDTINSIFDVLLENRHARDTTLVALGGGVVGDMTGFAAASYQRGVDFVQVPTTLLAQVDSSVGGKTGVNHRLGKNMIGAFHQPQLVVADTDTLNTLSDREFAAGMAEVIKYGLLGDAPFLAWLEANMAALMARDADVLAEAIFQSCANKARIVAADEREAGQRALLNLGHTFGHAIETAQAYKGLLHGEAVAVGMLMAVDMSARLGWLDDTAVPRTRALLQQANLPITVPAEVSHAQFSQFMALDKKVKAGQLRLILLKSLGDAIVTADFDTEALQATLAAFTQAA